MYPIDPRMLSAAMTQDFYSPWVQMQNAPPPFIEAPSPMPGPVEPHVPFVPVPVPVPTPPPGAASSTTVDPEPAPMTEAELMERLMKPYNKGWRKK